MRPLLRFLIFPLVSVVLCTLFLVIRNLVPGGRVFCSRMDSPNYPFARFYLESTLEAAVWPSCLFGQLALSFPAHLFSLPTS